MVNVIRTLNCEVYQVWEVIVGCGHPSGNPTRPQDGCPRVVVPVDLIVEVVGCLMTYAVDVGLQLLPGWKKGTPD